MNLIGRRRISTPLGGSQGTLLGLGLLTSAIVAYVALDSGASGDYSPRAQVAGDNAGPAINALIHGHLSSFVTHQPLMGLGSLLLRAPLAGLSVLMGADGGLAYGLGVLVCLMPLALLAAWMLDGKGPSEQRLGAVFAAAIVLGGPATVEAARVGHPEEVLAAALATAAVLAAVRGRPGWAWPLLGAAVGTKQWALLAAPSVLLALPDRRLAAAAKSGGLALALCAVLPLADPAAFLRANSLVGGVHYANPFSLWWPFGTPMAASAHGALAPTAHRLPLGLSRSQAAAAALGLVAAGIGLYWSRRADRSHRIDPLALLALCGLARCVTDPDPLQYYFVALLIPLAAWETMERKRLPLATVLAAGGTALLARGSLWLNARAGIHLTPRSLSALSIVGTAALGWYLVRRVVQAPPLRRPSGIWPVAFGTLGRSG